MKAGTTSLTAWLDAHPQVFIPRRKELHFFDLHHREGIAWYRRWFAASDSFQATGEATPAYMYREEAFSRMADLLPGAKLIAVLRHPVDRAYSHYWHRRNRGEESFGFGERIAQEEAGCTPSPGYLARGRYLEQLRRITSRYPREALHVILFDDLESRTKETYASLCRFLGVDHTIVPSAVGVAYTP